MSAAADLLIYLHTFSTVAMAGLIWFVQVVHYPLFARVGESSFPAYEREHQRRTGRVVIPLMLTEGATAVGLAVWLTAGLQPVATLLAWTGLVLLVAVWGSTFFLQVPLHRSLTTCYDPSEVRRLVAGNWIRTAGWTSRAGLALALFEQLR